MNNCISLKNLHVKDYDSKDLIKGVSFNIPQGSSVGIVGESGSGKSLTMKFILGFLPTGLAAEADHVEILGKNPYELNRNELANFIGQNVGYIPQNTVQYLHPLIKVKNQIADGYKQFNPNKANDANSRALSLLREVEIVNPENVMESLPSELSGGMRQRVNIAMAMMNEPKLVIADEPTTALDAEVQYQVMELLNQLHQEYDNTLIVISHDLSIIQKYCDYVIVLYNGEVQEVGTTDQIFNNPKAQYTKALLSVMIDLNQDPNVPLKDISYFLGKEIVL